MGLHTTPIVIQAHSYMPDEKLDPGTTAEAPPSSPTGAKRGRKPGTKSTDQRFQLVCYLAATGMPTLRISEKLDSAEATVSRMLSSDLGRVCVEKWRKEIFGTDAKEKLRALTNKALETVEGILDSTEAKDSVKLDAAKYIVDHNIGKALATVKVEGNLLSELIVKLDSKMRDVGPIQKELATTVDSLDNFVDELIPETVIVGKKTSDEV